MSTDIYFKPDYGFQSHHSKKCAMGLFRLIRHRPLFAEDQCRWSNVNRETKVAAAATTSTNSGGVRGNNALKRKRSSSSEVLDVV